MRWRQIEQYTAIFIGGQEDGREMVIDDIPQFFRFTEKLTPTVCCSESAELCAVECRIFNYRLTNRHGTGPLIYEIET